MDKGYIQIYTGEGKGKTTAAIGLAVRAIGGGKKVAIIQFMKKGEYYGEFVFMSKYTTMLQFGREGFVDIDSPPKEDIDLASSGLKEAEQMIFSGMYDIIILDEIVTAVEYGLLSEEQILGLMKNKPEEVELVLTGRGATKKMIESADLVTEMKETKHYYKKNVQAREGIEF